MTEYGLIRQAYASGVYNMIYSKMRFFPRFFQCFQEMDDNYYYKYIYSRFGFVNKFHKIFLNLIADTAKEVVSK